MVTTVLCPCCEKELYETAPLEGPHAGMVSGPPLEQDENGLFMLCSHCEKRIDFIGSGGVLHLSPIQQCRKL